MCMATTIVAPLLICGLQLAVSNPVLIFNSKRKDKVYERIIRIGVILTSLVNPIFLKLAHENIQEKLREYLLTSNLRDDEVIKLVNKKDEVKKKLSRLLKVDLGLELIYQITLQLILVLLSITKTPTTGGLEAFFEQTDNVVLILLTCWSFKTCVLIQNSAIKTEQIFFPFTYQLLILFWSLVAAGRRIMAIVVFFLPSLGLFSILNHWKAEQLPFEIRLKAWDFKRMTPNDTLFLNNITRNVSWTSIDRWKYNDKDQDKPQPPPYTLYTGLSLGHTFVAFLVYMSSQLFFIAVVKKITVKKKKNWFNFMVNILESINIPFPFKDWDTENLGVDEFKSRVREVNIEMAWAYLVNFIFNILMLCPFWWTGKSADIN